MSEIPEPGPTVMPPPSRFGILARPRFWVGLLVVAAWLLVMGRMWLRETGRMGLSLRQMGVSPEVLLVSWTDYEQWLWVEQNGKRIGVTTMRITPNLHSPARKDSRKELPGYVMSSRTRLHFQVMGINLPLDLATQVEMNAAFELESLRAAVEAAGQNMALQAFAEDKQLYYRLKNDAAKGDSKPKDRPWPSLPGFTGGLALNLPSHDICGLAPMAEPVFLSDAVIPILTRTETLRPGQRWTTKASDLFKGMMQADVQVTVEAREDLEIDGEKIETWRLSERVGTMQSTVWYDLRGRIVRCDMEGGLRLVQANPFKVKESDPAFNRTLDLPPIERPWIRKHVDPQLRGKPLAALLPALPSL